jgi:hypothetical protein
MDKEIVLGLIMKLQKEKEDKRIEPTHVLDVELLNTVTSKVRDCLNDLYKEGRIKVTKTINHNAISVVDLI